MSAAAPQAAPAPRPAATLILLRAGSAGPEVLMLQRTKSAVFLGGAYVFPGGALDQQDSNPAILERIIGLPTEAANARLNLKEDASSYYAAAVRECFEESGVALLCDATGRTVSAERAGALARYRERPFLELLQAQDLYIPGSALAYFGHWITTPGRPRRFDTRFFVALAPEGQEGSHDANETVHHMWVSPNEALARGERGEIELVFATQHTLRELARFSDCAAAFAHAAGLPEIPSNRACRALGREGERIFRRADPQYFEIHWCDPEETGATSYELAPGVPKRLDRFVTRLTAPNPGAMTGPGTNSYLVGEDELAIIDPGPEIDVHLEKIVSEGKKGAKDGKTRIRWILCTHTHLDHSPAAARLKAATGAQLLGRPAPAGQDATFKPDVVLEHGQRVD
ncbi:MAG TPA: MBL fold metallo-hydrolase, partial [Burkholderiales bacterium]|nr:MBL fold metallo-hydrolase [Burkholderiales bacterium]